MPRETTPTMDVKEEYRPLLERRQVQPGGIVGAGPTAPGLVPFGLERNEGCEELDPDRGDR